MESNNKTFNVEDLPKRAQLSKNVQKYQKDSIVTNYYKLENFKNHTIFQYDITFDPPLPEDSRAIFRGLVNSASEELKKRLKFFIHRGKIIFAFGKLDGLQSFNCKYVHTKKGTQDKEQFTNILNLVETKTFQLSSLHGGSKQAQKVLQVLNSDLKTRLEKAGLHQLGTTGKFYFQERKLVQNSPFHIFRGFTTSIHLINNELQMLIDVSTRLIRRDTLLTQLNKLKNDDRQQLIGRSVIATYGNWRIYTIKKIRNNQKASNTFDNGTQKITYVQYFKKRYGVTIKEVNQELILSSVKRKVIDKQGKLVTEQNDIYLVPELVNLTGMSEDEKNDYKLMQEVAKMTKMHPQERLQKARTLLSKLKNSELYSISQTESKVPGYILDQPSLMYGNGQIVRPQNGAYTTREKVLKPMTVKDWIIIYSEFNNNDRDVCDDFVATMKKCQSSYGIKLPEPDFIVIETGKIDQFIDKIKQNVTKYGKPGFFLTLLKPNEKKHYGALKKLFLNELAVPHQNVVTKTVDHEKKKMSACSKILLQINAKVGDPLWRVQQKNPNLKNKKILMGGMAIYHKLVNKNQSCCSFAGTVSDDQTEYYLGSKLVPQNQQNFESLYQMIEEWVKTYCVSTKSTPDTLIIYRDGVGEGQIPGIIENQVGVVNRAIQTIKIKMKKPDYNPGVVFVLANKKINQRLYDQRRATSRDRSKGNTGIGNPRSGTVVGHGISRYGFDFHMSPHNVTEGTCTPTQFNVIYNTSNLKEDEIWNLTFDSCFGYFNWTGAVRVPAPLQYANKLATLVGDSMKCEPNDKELKKKIYCL